MKLEQGQEVTFTGIVHTRRTINPRTGGQPFVKATMVTDDGYTVPVVWWDAGRAPATDVRVKVKGRVREYNNACEVHAYEWVAERGGPPADPIARVIGFYIGCVEAEAAGSVRIRPGGSGHLELGTGPSPVTGTRTLPSDTAVEKWCRDREMAVGESIVAGWPMIIGVDHSEEAATPVASPLLTADVRVVERQGTWQIDPSGGSVDLNPYALDLVGVDRAERDALVRAVEQTPAVEEARTALDRADAILEALRTSGISGLDDLNPQNLIPHDHNPGVHNTGLLLVSVGSTRVTRMLLEDLEELMANPEMVASGPAAVMLGTAPAPLAPLPEPNVTVVPSTLAQDQAVTSAMKNVLTVVTGPPGTGKSQVLVNVVAAAVARGETVLFASKNNQAVDVVFERLALTSPDACIVRAGVSSLRNDVANGIGKMLATPRRTVDRTTVRRRWADVEGHVRSIHEVLNERVRLDGELVELESDLYERESTLPVDADVDADLAELDGAARRARAAVDAFGDRLGIFRRWRKHQQRLEDARQELSELGKFLGLDRDDIQQALRSVVDKPTRSLTPREHFSTMESMVDAIRWIQSTRETVSQKQRELTALPSNQTLDDRLHEIGEARNAAGRALLDARWEEVRRDNPVAREAAGRLADKLAETATMGTGARQAKALVTHALPTLPVWGVTNLSARTNLPLQPGLFDLVVIDEASQCDVASALPLLVRAKRALIIGDRRQLTHITSLGRAREQAIATQWGLDDDRMDEFSYRSRSCFSLASSRVEESPIFLNLHFRSHPAIVGFSNERFYDGRLEICSESRPPADLPAIEWVRVDGDTQRGPRGRSFVNPREAQALAKALAGDAPVLAGLGLSVGVVTPYRAQAELIGDQLRRTLGDDAAKQVTVATAHRFQGDERDIMYFSPVVGPSMTRGQVAFAADSNLVNVALTRARRRLVVVGNMDACLLHNNTLTELARYTSRLEAGSFDSPLEQAIHEALLARGVAAETGVVVAGYRLDLAVRHDDYRLDIECDGAAFHTDRDADASRDRAIEAAGWRVIRFSGRQVSSDLEGCVEVVLSMLEHQAPARIA